MDFEQQEQRMGCHPADIIAALRKRKTTLAAVSREAGLSSLTLANALNRPCPKGGRLITDALVIPKSEIWPDRYFDSQGQKIPREIRHKNN